MSSIFKTEVQCLQKREVRRKCHLLVTFRRSCKYTPGSKKSRGPSCDVATDNHADNIKSVNWNCNWITSFRNFSSYKPLLIPSLHSSAKCLVNNVFIPADLSWNKLYCIVCGKLWHKRNLSFINAKKPPMSHFESKSRIQLCLTAMGRK